MDGEDKERLLQSVIALINEHLKADFTDSFSLRGRAHGAAYTAGYGYACQTLRSDIRAIFQGRKTYHWLTNLPRRERSSDPR